MDKAISSDTQRQILTGIYLRFARRGRVILATQQQQSEAADNDTVVNRAQSNEYDASAKETLE